jgi:hypothetical protein
VTFDTHVNCIATLLEHTTPEIGTNLEVGDSTDVRNETPQHLAVEVVRLLRWLSSAVAEMEEPVYIQSHSNLLLARVPVNEVPLSKENVSASLRIVHGDREDSLSVLVGLCADLLRMNVLIVTGQKCQSTAFQRRRVCEVQSVGNLGIDPRTWRRQKTRSHERHSRVHSHEEVPKQGLIASRVIAEELVHSIVHVDVELPGPPSIQLSKPVDPAKDIVFKLIRKLAVRMAFAVDFAFQRGMVAPTSRSRVEMETATDLIADTRLINVRVVEGSMARTENKMIVSYDGMTILRTAPVVCLQRHTAMIHCSSVLLP